VPALPVPERGMITELYGLEVFGHHGVLEWEQREGQTFIYDVTLEVEEPAQDRVEDAIDYREIVAKVEEVSSRRFQLIETLAAAVADALLEAFPAATVSVRVRKPRPGGITAEYSAATAGRSRS
jgi:7,8-dihydroneopterin aldolase/epimerase/oxygenase